MREYTVDYDPEAKAQILRYEMYDPASYRKVMKLAEELRLHPRTGTGQVEQLRHCLRPTWSRRINKKDRMLYWIIEEKVYVYVVQIGGHYGER